MLSIDAVELINNLPQDMRSEVMSHIDTLYLTSRRNYIIHFDKYQKRVRLTCQKIVQCHVAMITQCVTMGVDHYVATIPHGIEVDVWADGGFWMYDYNGLEILGSLVLELRSGSLKCHIDNITLAEEMFPRDEPHGISDAIDNMHVDYSC